MASLRPSYFTCIPTDCVAATLLALVLITSPADAQDARERIGALNRTTVQLLNAGKIADAVANAEKSLADAERTLQPTDPLIAQSLNNLAVLLGIAGRNAEAEPIYRRTLAFREKVPGPNQLDLAGALAEFGIWNVNNGRHAAAEPLLRRALTLREKALGIDDDSTLLTCLWLSASLRQPGQFPEAEALAKRTIAAREKKLGANHEMVADALDTLASTYDHAGRINDAADTYERALAIVTKALGPDHRRVAVALGNLSAVRRMQGRAADAVSLSQRALAIYEKQAGPDSDDVAGALSRLGGALIWSERPQQAEPHFRRALTISEKRHGPNSRAVATASTNLAVSLENQGRLSEAEPLQRHAIVINERLLGAEHPDIATMLINLATTYSKQKRTREAGALYQQALGIREKAFGANHLLTADALNHVGQFDIEEARFAEAETKLQRAAKILEAEYGRDHAHVANVLNNLAVVYGRTGRQTEEHSTHLRALKIREAVYGQEHFYVAQSLNNLAHAASRRGRTEEAEALYRRAVAMNDALYGPQSPRTAEFLRNLAAIVSTHGKHEEALNLARRAAAAGRIDKTLYAEIAADAGNAKVISGAESVNEAFVIVQTETASAAGGAINKLAARFAAGNGALAELVRKDQDHLAEHDALDRELIAALTRPSTQRDTQREDATRSRMKDIMAERRATAERLRKDFPDYASLSAPPAVSIPEAKALLASDEALVLIDVDQSLLMFSVTREIAQFDRQSDPKASDIDNLAALTKRVRNSIELGLKADDKAMPPFDAAAAYEIYKATLKRAEDLIADKPKLSVILSGTLTGIPPHLLVTADPTGKSNQDIDWLIKRHEITIYPSVTAFKLARTKSAVARAPKPLTGYANPVFGPPAPNATQRGVAKPSVASFFNRGSVDLAGLSRSLAPLPETEAELKSVGKNVKAAAADLKFGKSATETQVKNARLTDYRVLYFATHALVAGETALFVRNQAEPAIALTIPATATEIDDGLLTASEIAQLKLNADWVILSACNTASGDGNPGAEPLSGLARAFFYAGARSLLVSHWEVPSLSAVPLLTGVFDAKTANPGLTNAGALRQSMLAQLNDTKNPSWSHPVHWAPFIVVGDAR